MPERRRTERDRAPGGRRRAGAGWPVKAAGEAVLTLSAGATSMGCVLGVSGHLVGSAAFKAVEAGYKPCLVGSIPIHSRWKSPRFFACPQSMSQNRMLKT